MPSLVCDFRIALTSDPAADACCVALTRLPEGVLIVEEVVGGIDRAALQQRCAVLAGYIHDALPPEFLHALGTELARLLLPARVRNVLTSALWQQPEATVRIWLQAAPEWDGLPWEYAYMEADGHALERGEFLCLHPRLRLIRQQAMREGVVSASRSPVACSPFKIVLAWADPASSAYPHLPGLAEEVLAIQTALRAPECRGAQVETLRSATREGLRRTLHEQQPHVLHFLGHGDTLPSGGVLILERGQAGGEERLYGEELAEWLAETPVRLAVLSACHTASPLNGVTRTLIEKQVAAVVGMQFPMRDTTAASFARAFYGTLIAEGVVEEAVQQARQGLRSAGPDWGVPLLYMREASGPLFTRMPAENAVFPPPTHPFFTNLPYLQNPNFTGREEDLRRLHETMHAHRNVAVVGMGGLGKTQLVSEYAHAHLKEYPGGIFWVDARNSARLKEEYAALSRHFDVPDTLSVDERAQRMRMLLQQGTQPTLVIYDNVTDEMPLALLPAVGPCRLLATTRQVNLVPAAFDKLRLETLSEGAALALLQTGRTLSDEKERTAARQIAGLVGGLPLALALVANHVRRLDMSFISYLKRLQQGPEQMLGRARVSFIGATQHDGSLFDTIDLSFCLLSETAKQALTSASCFAPRGISPDLLRSVCRELEEDDYYEALGELKDYSLLTREHDERITLHELVRVYAQGQMTPDARQERLIRVCETLAEPLEKAEEAMEWQPVRREAEHCRAVASLCRDNQVQAGLDRLLRAHGAFALAHGEFTEAKTCFEESMQMFEARLGRQSSEVAKTRMKLAEVKHAQGDSKEALSHAREAFAIAEAVYPLDSLAMAEFYNDLGVFLEYAGSYAESLAFSKRALERFQVLCGVRSAQVAMCLNNIGNACEFQGDLEQARAHLESALITTRHVLGQRHEQAALQLNNLGRVLAKQKNFEEALAQHQEALKIYEAFYGRKHPRVAASLFYCGEAQAELGRIADARTNYTESLELYHFFFGEADKRYQTVQEQLNRLP